MGCCISSIHNSHTQKPNKKHSLIPADPEEEAIVVKEIVLSEDPKIPELPPLESSPVTKSAIPRSPESPNDPKTTEKCDEMSEIEVSVSGFSDFVRFSGTDEARSTSTASIAVLKRREKIKDEGDAEGEVVGPSAYFPKKKGFSDDFTGAGGRLSRVRPTEKSSCLVVPARGNIGAARFRRVSGEGACRRSSSLRTAAASGEGRRAVGNDVNVKTGAPCCRLIDGVVKNRRVVEEPNDGVSGSVTESLENLLVSFECFIFL